MEIFKIVRNLVLKIESIMNSPGNPENQQMKYLPRFKRIASCIPENLILLCFNN